MHFCGGYAPCSQATNVARLIPSIAAVRRSLSFDSLVYRPNASKTSSVVISADGHLERVGAVTVPPEKIGLDPLKSGNYSIAGDYSLLSVPWAHLFAC